MVLRSGVTLLLAFAGLVAACGTAATDVKVGDCFDGAPADQEVTTVETKPCTEPHEKEVFAVFDFPGGGSEFPGTAAIDAAADTGCVRPFQDYVGTPLEDSSLGLFILTPTEGSWRSGDRAIACILEDPNGGKLTGSMKGSRR